MEIYKPLPSLKEDHATDAWLGQWSVWFLHMRHWLYMYMTTYGPDPIGLEMWPQAKHSGKDFAGQHIPFGVERTTADWDTT